MLVPISRCLLLWCSLNFLVNLCSLVYQWLIEATSEVDATFQMFAALVFSGNKEEAINIAKVSWKQSANH